MSGKVVFRGAGANGGTYEIIQSGPTDFMIHANGRHIDTYGSLQRAMSVLQNEVPGLQQGMAENMADDMAAMAQKKFPTAYISKDGQEVQKPENWGKRYTPPAAAPADLEKQQRDLTAKYPNIDELVRRAELNRDPDYEMADGEAYYAARDAEQNYQKLRQIQRVIQGLNESLQRTQP